MQTANRRSRSSGGQRYERISDVDDFDSEVERGEVAEDEVEIANGDVGAERGHISHNEMRQGKDFSSLLLTNISGLTKLPVDLSWREIEKPDHCRRDPEVTQQPNIHPGQHPGEREELGHGE